MSHLDWEPAWVPAVMLFLGVLLARFIRSGGTAIRVGRLVCLSAGVGCLLVSVTVFAQEPTGQDTGADRTQADIATLPTVTVQEKALDNARARITPNLGATTYTLDSDKIDSQSQGEFASFDQTFYRFPGVAQDELDKRLHVRGEEANLQYRINGLLLPDGAFRFRPGAFNKIPRFRIVDHRHAPRPVRQPHRRNRRHSDQEWPGAAWRHCIGLWRRLPHGHADYRIRWQQRPILRLRDFQLSA